MPQKSLACDPQVLAASLPAVARISYRWLSLYLTTLKGIRSPSEELHTMSTRDYRHRERSHRDHDSRSRSRSPDRSGRHKRHHHHRRRHSHHRHRDYSHDRDRHSQSASSAPAVLPFKARELSKRDLTYYAPMFAMYLDIQKGLIMEDLSEEEIKGRWKSFIRKW